MDPAAFFLGLLWTRHPPPMPPRGPGCPTPHHLLDEGAVLHLGPPLITDWQRTAGPHNRQHSQPISGKEREWQPSQQLPFVPAAHPTLYQAVWPGCRGHEKLLLIIFFPPRISWTLPDFTDNAQFHDLHKIHKHRKLSRLLLGTSLTSLEDILPY